MLPRNYLKGLELTARACKESGLTFADLWKYVHIHFYDGEPVESCPWRLRLVPEGTAALRSVPLDARPLLTVWALERWLAEEQRDGPLAQAAQRAVHDERTEHWAKHGLEFKPGRDRGGVGRLRKAINAALDKTPTFTAGPMLAAFRRNPPTGWSFPAPDQIWIDGSGSVEIKRFNDTVSEARGDRGLTRKATK